MSPEALRTAKIERLSTPAELELIRLVAQWPRIVAAAATAHEPHRIAFYLYDLAAAFHGFWAKGNEDPSLRFVIANDPELTLARLALVAAVRQVLVNGLSILGVFAPRRAFIIRAHWCETGPESAWGHIGLGTAIVSTV